MAWRNSGRTLRPDFLDQQGVQPAAIDAHDLDVQITDAKLFAALGQAAQMGKHQSAHGIEILVAEIGAESPVEIVYFGLRLDAKLAISIENDVGLGFVEVELVFDLADDLFEHVLDRDQAGHAAVLVDDDRDMVAVAAEILQQDVQPLRFRDENRGTQSLAHVEFIARVIAQQVLGQQNADDVVLVLADHGKTRVAGFDHERNEFLRRVADVYDIHLRAWDHDVPRLHLGHLHDALDHRQGVGIQQVALVGALQ